MAKITASFILVILVGAFLNGINSVEGAGRDNKLEKDDDDGIYKSIKLGHVIDCLILRKWCVLLPLIYCPLYYSLCPHTTNTAADAPKPQNLP